MAIRDLHPDTKTALIENKTLNVFHLVKFEKPSNLIVESPLATDYAYLTDAYHDVVYDGQTYTSGSLLSVGNVQETTEAKATNINLVISATKLGTYSIATFTTSSITSQGNSVTITSDLDLFKSGFYVGDEITITNRATPSQIYTLRIDKLAGSGTTVVATVTSEASLPALSGVSFDVKYTSAEVTALSSDKTSLNYANYVNRTVSIYRVYANPEDGTWYGTPSLLFEGIIAKASVNESASGAATVAWNLTSHWGDFVRVQGRLTSDEYHRALDVNGLPDIDSAMREEYAYDKGFEHSEQALNVTATYTDIATRTKMVRRGGFAGLIGLQKAKEEKYEVERNLDLRLNLAAKFLPVVYGVQKIDSIPVFADVVIEKDSDSNDIVASGSTTLYTVNALCEGPIGGILNIYMDDKGLVCSGEQDSDVRGGYSAEDVPCIGRMDKGEVLGGSLKYDGATPAQVAISDEDLLRAGISASDARFVSYFQQAANAYYSQANTSEVGILHEESFEWDDANGININFHAGLDNQDVDQDIAKVAAETKFLVQQKYYEGNKQAYWSGNHRLLDTAYTTSIDVIAAEDGRAPEYQYVVRGKFINCYNYDGTYRALNFDTQYTWNSATGSYENVVSTDQQFNLGDTVTIEIPDGTQYSARIIDKFFFYDAFGRKDWRFKLKTGNSSVDTNLNNGTYGKVLMISGSGDQWLMISEDWSGDSSSPAAASGVLSTELQDSQDTLSYTYKASGNVSIIRTVQINNATAAQQAAAANGVSIPSTNRSVTYEVVLSGLSTDQQNTLKAYKACDYADSLANTDCSLNFLLLYTIDGTTAASRVIYSVRNLIDNGDGTFSLNLNSLSNNYTIEQFFPLPGYSDAVVTKTGTFEFTTSQMIYRDSADTYALSNLKGVGITFESLDKTPRKTVPAIPHKAGATSSDPAVIDTALCTALDNLGIIPLYKNALYSSNPVTYYYGGRSVVSGNQFADMRVSINPAIQLLDYLTSKTYGKGLDINLIDLDSFKETARACDSQSDVTILTTTQATIGAAYYYNNSNGDVIFEGTVSSSVLTNGFYETTFTDIIGKLGRKWYDWKEYKVGDIVWTTDGSAAVITSAGVLATEPNTPLTATLTLENVSNSSDTISVDLSTDRLTPEGNPIVKKYVSSSDSTIVSGYSLYDADEVKYWKYLGWDALEQRYATRHQTNITLDTSRPIFDNVNMLLDQFNGILRYSNGKYYLGLKTQSKPLGDFDEKIEIISEDDIIGNIKLEDKGISNTYNSLTASIIDPANSFEGRNISFFNSTYLKQDKGIPRQGNFGSNAITNYYNARMAVKQRLDESRYGLDVSFTLSPKSYLLLAGEIIAVNYSRFNWDNKLFRISSLSVTPDNLVQVVAREHNDEAYLIESLKSSIFEKYEPPVSKAEVSLGLPSNLTASQDQRGGIQLNWENSTQFDRSSHLVEIWRSDSSTFNLNPLATDGNGDLIPIATNIARSSSNSYLDVITELEKTTKYYWIRYAIRQDGRKGVQEVYSKYAPLHTSDGVEGISLTSIIGGVQLLATDYSIVYDNGYNTPSFTSGANPTDIDITADAPYYNFPLYRFKVGSNAWTAWSLDEIYSYTVPTTEQDFVSSLVFQVEVGEDDGTGSDVDVDTVATDSISIISVTAGSEGTSAITVVFPNASHTVPCDSAGTPTSFTGSGSGTIEVFEGATQLAYNSTPSAGQWKIETGTISGIVSTPNFTSGGAVDNYSSMGSDVVTVPFIITYVRANGTQDTYTVTQTLTKSIAGTNGDPGAPGAPGSPGDAGAQTATGYVYYIGSGTPTSAPANSTHTFTFSTGTFGASLATAGWSLNAPTAGTTTREVYYAYFKVEEATAGDGYGLATFPGGVQLGTNFEGLVTFIGDQLSQDGGQSVTQINGGAIKASTAVTVGSGNNVAVLSGADATYRIWAGNASGVSAPFSVTQAGALKATSAEISGKLETDEIKVTGDGTKQIGIIAGAVKEASVGKAGLKSDVWDEVAKIAKTATGLNTSTGLTIDYAGFSGTLTDPSGSNWSVGTGSLTHGANDIYLSAHFLVNGVAAGDASGTATLTLLLNGSAITGTATTSTVYGYYYGAWYAYTEISVQHVITGSSISAGTSITLGASISGESANLSTGTLTFEYSEAPSVSNTASTTATSIPWTGVQSTPTTLSGYGITDAYTKVDSDARFLGLTAKAADSNLLDGIDSASFLRSDVADTFSTLSGTSLTSGTFYVNNTDTILQQTTGGALKVTTANGYVYFGPSNAFDYCHFYTDKNNYYFDTTVTVNGTVGVYSGSGTYHSWLGSTGIYTNGVIIAGGDITAFGSTSDLSLKENIEVIDNAVEKVQQLSGVTFNYIDRPDTRMTGLIAQDLQKVLPEAVYQTEDEKLAVRYGNTVGLLIEAIKEQQAQINALTQEIKELKNG